MTLLALDVTQIGTGSLGAVVAGLMAWVMRISNDQRKWEIELRATFETDTARREAAWSVERARITADYDARSARDQGRINEMQSRLDDQQDQINALIQGTSPPQRRRTTTRTVPEAGRD